MVKIDVVRVSVSRISGPWFEGLVRPSLGLRNDGGMNRLGSATSPYLPQHKGNPGDWGEWGEDAFREAERRHVTDFA